MHLWCDRRTEEIETVDSEGLHIGLAESIRLLRQSKASFKMAKYEVIRISYNDLARLAFRRIVCDPKGVLLRAARSRSIRPGLFDLYRVIS